MDNRRVLVLEDDNTLRCVMVDALAHHGYEPVAAPSGVEALKLLDETPAWVQWIDLKLPGMSGVDFCRESRDQWPLAICLAMTGYASVFELAHCREVGFDDYYRKPLSVDTMLAATADAFARHARWGAG